MQEDLAATRRDLSATFAQCRSTRIYWERACRPTKSEEPHQPKWSDTESQMVGIRGEAACFLLSQSELLYYRIVTRHRLVCTFKSISGRSLRARKLVDISSNAPLRKVHIRIATPDRIMCTNFVATCGIGSRPIVSLMAQMIAHCRFIQPRFEMLLTLGVSAGGGEVGVRMGRILFWDSCTMPASSQKGLFSISVCGLTTNAGFLASAESCAESSAASGADSGADNGADNGADSGADNGAD